MSDEDLPQSGADDLAAPVDDEVARVLDGYLVDLEAGHPADPERLLAEHPAIASELKACLEVMAAAAHVAGGPGMARGRSALRPGDAAARPAARSLFSTWDFGAGPPPRVQLHELAQDEGPPLRRRFQPAPAMPERGMDRYQLEGEIARGGMGAIFKGRDVDLGRELAIKLLLESQRDNSEVVRRFVEEAQIGGQLQHPGIVPVYELGTCADRRPYIAMKLVKGRSLASLLEERADPTQDLSRFLGIFEQVCQTMAYAHARGVIHRDLKPSNVMVGTFGEVQVMDWGLAKVLPREGVADEPTGAPAQETVIMTVRSGSAGSGCESQAGSVLGTPAYMAPEQARGEVERIDERADVFGLGAILCEILTGRPLYAGATREAVRTSAARGDLADALNRLNLWSADSELIGLVRDCVASEPERRPSNAGEVATRLSGYMAGVQERLKAAELARVEAQTRADEEGKRRAVADELAREAHRRAEEERKRRRATVALAASVLLTAGVLGGGWGYRVRERNARLMATTSAVNDALAEAEQFRGQAQSAAADDLTRWSLALGAARRARDSLAEGEADEALRNRVSIVLADLTREEAAAQSRALEVKRDRELFGQLETIRGSTNERNDSNRADAEYAKAFRRFGIDLDRLDPREAGKRMAERSDPVELASFVDDWALSRRLARGKKDEASWQRLLAAIQVADADPWRAALRERISRDDLEAVKRLAADQETLAVQPARTLVLLARALKELGDTGRAEAVLLLAWRREPGDFWVNLDLGSVRWVLSYHARPAETTRFASAAVALRPKSYVAHMALGASLRIEKRFPEAIDEFREALRLEPDSSRACRTIEICLRDSGKVTEAIDEARASLRLHPDSADFHCNLAVALHRGKIYDEAIDEFRASLRINPDSGDCHYELGVLFDTLSKADLAIDEFRAALGLNPDDRAARFSLGMVLASQGKLGDAITEYRAAIRLNPNDAQAHGELGFVLVDQGRYTEALAEITKGHELAAGPAWGGWWHPGVEARVQAAQMAATLDPAWGGWWHPGVEAVRSAQRFVEQERELPAILRGQAQPASAVASLTLSQICFTRKLYGASARLRANAVATEPALVADKERHHRYNAACAAALAGSGQGEDDPPLDQPAKSRWRKHALDWLKADLALLSQALQSADLRSRHAVIRQLELWQKDPHLAGIREPAALADLQSDEQKAWRDLWSEVGALLARQTRRTAQLNEKLPAIVSGRAEPADAAESLALAQMCYEKKLYGASARMWHNAFSTQPSLADDMRFEHRYNAACAAALAGAGQSKDDPPLDEMSKARWRKQALDWLRADIAAWSKTVESAPFQARADVAGTLQRWKADYDLFGLRSPGSVAKLAADEQKACRAIWAEVDALLAKAHSGTKP